jgi:3-oxoacyl-[acyl-carrier-protein] synthase III
MVVNSVIRGISYYLPPGIVSNADLAKEFPEWPVDKIEEKTGILERHIAAPQECSSDLAFCAAQNLFRSGICTAAEIDFILLCTQSPDYFLPTTACLLQDRLGIPTSAGALDFNLGCSGYIYGLGLAHGLIQSGQARNVLFLTAETYSKFIHPRDKSVRTVFGDAAAATLIAAAGGSSRATHYVFGTDGRGAGNLIVPEGAMRQPHRSASAEESDGDAPHKESGVRSQESEPASAEEFRRDTPGPKNLYMNGGEVFNFTLQTVPGCVASLLEKAEMSLEEIDLFVFHQANQFMLDHLRRKLKVPPEKFYIALASCGNTVSSTLPIALENSRREGKLRDGSLVMLVGFGVGYSWGATLIEWPYLGYQKAM